MGIYTHDALLKLWEFSSSNIFQPLIFKGYVGFREGRWNTIKRQVPLPKTESEKNRSGILKRHGLSSDDEFSAVKFDIAFWNANVGYHSTNQMESWFARFVFFISFIKFLEANPSWPATLLISIELQTLVGDTLNWATKSLISTESPMLLLDLKTPARLDPFCTSRMVLQNIKYLWMPVENQQPVWCSEFFAFSNYTDYRFWTKPKPLNPIHPSTTCKKKQQSLCE